MSDEPDWKGAYMALERYVIAQIGQLGAFAEGLSDHSPTASRCLIDRLLDTKRGPIAEIDATHNLYHLDQS